MQKPSFKNNEIFVNKFLEPKINNMQLQNLFRKNNILNFDF